MARRGFEGLGRVRLGLAGPEAMGTHGNGRIATQRQERRGTDCSGGEGKGRKRLAGCGSERQAAEWQVGKARSAVDFNGWAGLESAGLVWIAMDRRDR